MDFLKNLWANNKNVFMNLAKALLKGLVEDHLIPAAKALALKTDNKIDDAFVEQLAEFVEKLFADPSLMLADKDGVLPAAAEQKA